ncbi:membrane protein YigM [Escherichia coli]|uniref:Membrane protein YigM n=1 Tax=Escherichia coli TaxID=562 RepID=A0A2X3M9R7_ECOLX|nr:membrane protein YigM [Escherichia coli]
MLLVPCLAVIGAGIIRYDQVTDHFWTGLLLVQLSNITFAIGMVGYKRLMETRPMPQHNAFAWFYLGAFLVAVMHGSCWEMRRKCRKPRCNGAFWCSWRGGFRDWLLYVELRRDAGGRRNAGNYE